MKQGTETKVQSRYQAKNFFFPNNWQYCLLNLRANLSDKSSGFLRRPQKFDFHNINSKYKSILKNVCYYPYGANLKVGKVLHNTCFINLRHVFYGMTNLEKVQKTYWFITHIMPQFSSFFGKFWQIQTRKPSFDEGSIFIHPKKIWWLISLWLFQGDIDSLPTFK